MNPIVVKARAHLAMVLGEIPAERLLAECRLESGATDLASLDEVLKLGEAMLARGGFVEVVGRFMRVQAIVQGSPAPLATR